MSVTLTIGERSFEIAPYKLKDLRKAAPFIEEMNVLAKRMKADIDAQEGAGVTLNKLEPNVEDLFAMAHTMCEIIAIGLVRIDPAMTADALEDMIDTSFLGSLQAGCRALLVQSGLAAPGEATAPSPPPLLETGPDQEALASSLEESSAS